MLALTIDKNPKVKIKIKIIIIQSFSTSFLLSFTRRFTPPYPILEKWGKFPNLLLFLEPGNRALLFQIGRAHV